jgi:2-methylfumaryl-CoA isomerase
MYELLKGVRVVEGAAFVAGPSCGLYLAQMGAEVIRFDNIGGGPDFKRWPLTENGESLYWEGLNRAKKSVAINLSSPEGRALAVRLAGSPGENGGLFVTNFPAEGFLSYEALKKAREDLICVRVMGWADGKPALDYTINCAVGVPEMTGHPEDPRPVNAMLPAWDLLTGAYGAFALTSALIARRMDGKGREIRVPLSDIAATSLAHLGLVGDVIGGAPDRPKLGNALYGAFGRDFTTRDGKRIMMVAITGRQWKAIMGSLGITEAVAALEAELGVSFADDEGLRFDHRDRLFPIFEKAFANRDLADMVPTFDSTGVCWGPYQPLSQAVEDPRLYRGNPVFADIDNPSGRRYLAPGAAGTIPQDARLAPRAAPKLGAHTDEVLMEILGMSSAEVGKLHDAGVVAGPTA